MEAQYKNDMFVATLVNPNATLQDFVASGLNSDNTNLLTPEEYKQTKVVKEQFSKDGVFDDQKFNDFYYLAANKYRELTDNNAEDRLVDLITYDSSSRYAEFDKIRNDQPTVTKIQNPFDEKIGISSLFGESASNKSMRELAQMNTHYFDWNKQEWVEESPDQFGISSLWREPMVYAQWDEDGTHVDPTTSQVVSHKKGEWKTDENGRFYLETLGNRESYGKQVLSALDTLVSEDSTMQSIAFWESDEKEKSVMGTTMRLIAQIAPFFIPGFNTYWGGLHMAWGLASVLPTFYKAAEGLLFGDSHSLLWESANKAENWFSKFDLSLSDEAQDSFWNYEQMSKMVGDVFSQIYEQRAAAKMASKFLQAEKKATQNIKQLTEKYSDEIMDFMKATGGNPTTEQMNTFVATLYLKSPEFAKLAKQEQKLAKTASLGYMALTQAVDVYGDALQAGYDEHAAGFSALLAASGQYVLMMNNSMGDWFMRGIFGYNEQSIQRTIRKAIQPHMTEINKSVQDINNAISADAKKTALEKLAGVFASAKRGLKKAFNDIKYGTEEFWGRAGIEAVEEVTEEAAIDAAKGITDGLSWLGVWNKEGDFFDEEHPFLSKATLDRYITSAVGGFVGGALFEFNDRFINRRINGGIDYETTRELMEFVADGKTNELLNMVDKIVEADDNKSSIKGITINTSEGAKTIYPTSEKENSRAQIVGSVVKNHIKWLDGVMNQEDLKQDDDSVLRKALLNTQAIKLFKDSGLSNYVIEEFKEASQKVVETLNKIKALGDKEVSKELQDELAQRREVISNIINGNNQDKYMKVASFVLNPTIKQAFDDMDIFSYTEYKYGKKFGEMTEEEKKEAEDSYKEYTESKDYKKFLDVRIKAFEELEGKLSPEVKKFLTSNYNDIRQITNDKLFSYIQYNQLVKDLKAYFNEGRFRELINLGIKHNKDKEEEIATLATNVLEAVDKGDPLVELVKLYSAIATTPESIEEIKPVYENIIKNLNFYKSTLSTLHLQALENNTEGINFDELLNTNLLEIIEETFTAGKIEDQYKQQLKLTFGDTISEEKLNEYAKVLAIQIQDIVNQIAQNYPITTLSSNFITQFFADIYNNLNQRSLEFANQQNTLYDKASELRSKGESTEEVDQQIEQLEVFKHLNKINFDGIDDVNDINVYYRTLLKFLQESPTLDGDILHKFEQYARPLLNKQVDLLVKKYLSNAGYGIKFNESEIQAFKNELWENREDPQAFDKLSKKIHSVIKGLINVKFGELSDVQDENEAIDYDSELGFFTLLKVSSLVNYGKLYSQLSPEEQDIVFKEAYAPFEDNIMIDGANILAGTTFSESNKVLNDLNELYKKPVIENSLYEFLDKLSLYFGDSKEKSIFKILQDLKVEINSLKADQFILSESSKNAIKRGISVINMLNAVVEGMIEIPISQSHPFGFNSAIVRYLNKYESGRKAENYITVQESEVTSIKSDLQRLKERLEFISTLSSLNQESQMSKHIKSRKAFRNLVKDKLNQISKQVDNVLVTSEIPKILLNTDIEDDDKILQCEKIIYKNFQSLLESESPVNALKKLYSEFGISFDKEVLKKQSNGLTEDTKDMSNYDWIVYLTSIVSNDPYIFANKYLELLKIEQTKDPKNQKAPLFGQEYATRVAFAVASNPELFDAMYSILPPSKFTNGSRIFYLSAIGGAGKTSTVANYIFNLLIPKGTKTSVEFYAPNTRARASFIENVLGSRISEFGDTIEGNVNGLKKLELLSRFVKNAKDVLNEIENPTSTLKYTKKNDNLYEITDEVEIITDNTPKFLFLDETTNLEKPYLEILQKVAQKTGMKIFAFGDNAQIGKFSTLDDIITISPIRLEMSLRDSNSLKRDNNTKIHNILNQLITYGKLVGENTVKAKLASGDYNLQYYQSNKELIGEKIISSISDEVKVIANPLLADSTKSLAIIVEKDKISDELKNALEAAGITEYKVYSIDSNADNAVQGAEATYVIADNIDFSGKSDEEQFQQFRKLYTVISRSFNGTLIYDKNDTIFKTFGITSKESKSYTAVQGLNETSKKEELENRINILSKILKDHPLPASAKTSSKEETLEKSPEKEEASDPGEAAVKSIEEETVVPEEDLEDVEKEKDKEEKEPEPELPLPPTEKTEFDTHDPKTRTKGKKEYTDLWIYPFYVKLGNYTIKDGKYNFLNIKNNEIAVFEGIRNGEYTKQNILDFILLKNALSLYSKNGLKYALKHPMYKSLRDTLGLTSDKDVEQFVENMQDIKIIASKYNPEVDSPFKAFEWGTHSPLNRGDIFIRAIRPVKIGDKIHNITIQVFPNPTTVNDAKSVTQDTKDDYNELCAQLNEKLSKGVDQVEISIDINFDSRSKFLSGIQMLSNLRSDESEEGVSLTQFAEHGFYYSEIEVLRDNTTREGAAQYKQFLDDLTNEMVVKSDSETKEEFEKRWKNKQEELKARFNAGGQFRLRGKPIVQVMLTPDSKMTLTLHPKKRSFNKVISELSGLVKSGQYTVLSRYDAIKTFLQTIKALRASAISGNVDKAFLNFFITKLRYQSNKIKGDKKMANRYKTWNDIVTLLESSEIQNILDSLSDVISPEVLKEEISKIYEVARDKGYDYIFSILGYELFHTFRSLDKNEKKDFLIKDDKNTFIKASSIFNIISSNFADTEFYYGKVTYTSGSKILFEEQKNKNNFLTHSKVEMPILSINFSKLINGTTEPVVEEPKSSDTDVTELKIYFNDLLESNVLDSIDDDKFSQIINGLLDTSDGNPGLIADGKSSFKLGDVTKIYAAFEGELGINSTDVDILIDKLPC